MINSNSPILLIKDIEKVFRNITAVHKTGSNFLRLLVEKIDIENPYVKFSHIFVDLA